MVYICRLCGKNDYDIAGVEIFSQEGVNKALAYKIKLSLDISVYEYDPLPKYVCNVCIEKLFTTFTFQESCRRTQIELRERVLATGRWSLPGTAINVQTDKQPNNVSGQMLPKVVSSETLQSSTSADTGTPIRLSGQPFEFGTFMRNGVLDDLAKAMTAGNPKTAKSKKPKQISNTRRKQQHENNTYQEQSSFIAPQNNMAPVSNQPSVIQAVQLPQNTLVASNQPSVMRLSNGIMSCSAGTQTHEVTNAMPFFAQLAPNQQDGKCESIQIVDVYSVRDPNTTSVTIPTSNNTSINNPNPCISLISGTQTIAIPMMDASMASPSYITPASNSVPISFIVTPNPPNAGTWHSPTLPNTLGSLTTVPNNFQNSAVPNNFQNSAVPNNFQNSTVQNNFQNSTVQNHFQTSSVITPMPTTRNWHTPSQTMPESSIQTSSFAEKSDRSEETVTHQQMITESTTNTTSHPITITSILNSNNNLMYTPQSRINNSSESRSISTLESTPNTSESRISTISNSTPNTLESTPSTSESRMSTTSKSTLNTLESTPNTSETMSTTPKSTPNTSESRTSSTLKSTLITLESRTSTISKSTPTTSESRMNTTSDSVASNTFVQQDDNDDDDDKDDNEEDDIFIVEVVKANKGSIAQHWEKCDEGYKCKDCKKIYKKLVKCENHIRTHLGIRPFQCKVCKRRFLKRRLLNEHNITHSGNKLYHCKECPKAFRYRKNFKLHLEIHTEVVSRSYLCEICRKTFKSQYEYWNHKTSKHIIDDVGTVVID